MSYPTTCNKCSVEKVRIENFDWELNLEIFAEPRPDAQIMLIGQDPTIAKGKAKTILTLGESRSPLRIWLRNLFEATKITLEEIYATNAIKCTFSRNQTPSRVAQRLQKTIVELLFPFFEVCKSHLISEIIEIKPRVVIALGQPVHQILIRSFGWKVPNLMKSAFGHAYKVRVGSHDFVYVPCIHMNSQRKQFYKEKWDAFCAELQGVVNIAG